MMLDSNVKELKWAIMASGGICAEFVGDLLLDPKTRGAEDVQHTVVAVASESGKAPGFVAKMYTEDRKEESEKIKTYNNYSEMLVDPNVEIVYIASPQSHHYRHVKLCLDAGKHVLCEKPFTLNGKQAKALCDLAKQKQLFLMEARWTKFFQLFKEVKKLLHENRAIGKIYRVHSDFGERLPENHRLFDKDLGGGSLLDIGIYPLTYISMMLWDHPENQRTPPTVRSALRMNKEAGVDEDAMVNMTFDKIDATGLLTSNIRVDLFRSGHHTIVYGTDGHLTISGTHTSRPTSYTLYRKGERPKEFTPSLPGWGMMWEADECARCIRDGRLESSEMSHGECASKCGVARATNLADFMWWGSRRGNGVRHDNSGRGSSTGKLPVSGGPGACRLIMRRLRRRGVLRFTCLCVEIAWLCSYLRGLA